ncbi:MAG: phosphotransferase [Planctomycetota bacterium]|jgi:Ser/Thr protein kinase RdoA (MazF antagonist)|nr:hypothetical protein [Planctomycetota bacterium]MDP6408422.1 phosphotransferase [Planctomycetota bacterium]MDP6540725.1 phosphotransferase [Planctomycetota bacterium]
MESSASPRARFSAAAAERLAESVFACAGRAVELESYDDRNFALTDGAGARFVLKVTRPGERREVVEAQNACLVHLADAGIEAPRVVPARDGRTLVEVEGPDGSTGLARLLSWVRGRRVADLPQPPALLEDLGRFVGALDRALADFDHPALARDFDWDLRNASRIRAHLEAIDDDRRRGRIAAWLDRIESDALGALAALRRGVVHNDPNGHNLLVADPAGLRVTGIIDFGDLLETAVVSDLAIAMAYVLGGDGSVFTPARHVLRGYLPRFALEAEEVALLPLLAVARLCVSVVSSARATRLDPSNEYIRISEPQAWGALDRLEPDDAERAADEFLEAHALHERGR